MTAMTDYDYDPDPAFLTPEEYAESVWSSEPELRTYETPKGIAWVAANFYAEFSDFDVTSEETDYNRWSPSMSHRDYSYHKNLFRQLVSALHPHDVDVDAPHSLRLSWIQAMDYEFVLIELENALKGTDGSKSLDFYPLNHVEDEAMPTAEAVHDERKRLREECIKGYRLAFPDEPTPGETDEETERMVEEFKKCRDSSY